MANSVNEEKPKKGGKKVAFTEMILPLVDTTNHKRKGDKKKGGGYKGPGTKGPHGKKAPYRGDYVPVKINGEWVSKKPNIWKNNPNQNV